MTAFTGPLIVRPLDAETTALRVGADGSAQFTRDVVVSGRIRHGPIGGALQDQTITQSVVINMQTHTARASIMNFPLGSTLTNIAFSRLDDALSTAASDVELRIGTSADITRFVYLTAGISDGSIAQATNSWTWPGTISHGVITAAAIMQNVQSAADTHWFVETTAVSGAVTGKRALLTVEYIRGV